MHIPRKRFGQHFLHDSFVIDKIVQAIAPKKTDHMIEIGPGLGALTERLLPHLKNLTVIELDKDLGDPFKNLAVVGKPRVEKQAFNYDEICSC